MGIVCDLDVEIGGELERFIYIIDVYRSGWIW